MKFYTEIPDLLFLNGWYSTTYGGLYNYSNSGTSQHISILGKYEHENNGCVIAVNEFTGDGGGYTLEFFLSEENYQEYETTSPGSGGCFYLVLAFDDASFGEIAQSWPLNFHIYWESYDGEEYYDDYRGTLYYQNEDDEIVFTGVCADLSNAEEYPVTMTYDGMYFHVYIGDDTNELSFYA